ncbi:uncharacterized protein LOC142239866 [Haematobia irritans]|uniref:uncharacterized protein LOC142239866 n=1 Tax=Haematobia irritans TaxID=7368 RepID=UPI003F500CCE
MLSNSQAGFRRGKSTCDNATALWSAAQLASREGKYMVTLFLDIKNAFENVNIDILIGKYEALGINPDICHIIHKMFQYKDLVLVFEGKEIQRRSYTGTPQGSVLSPLSFNIYIDEVFRDLNVDIMGYADDLVIFNAHADVEEAMRQVQEAVNSVSDRLKSIQLCLSPQKSKYMIFRPSKNIPTLSSHIQIGGANVDCFDQFNFLGYIFEPRLRAKPHANYIRRKCFEFTNILRALCGVSWGSDPQNILLLYKGVLRPRIEYMAPLMLDYPTSEMIKLQRIQFKAIRIALGAMISTHTLALEQEAAIMPIPDRINYLSNQYVNRMISNISNPAIQYLDTYCNNYAHVPKLHQLYREKRSDFLIERHAMALQYQLSYTALVTLPRITYLNVKRNSTDLEVIKRKYARLVENKRSQFTVFTDGSKTAAKTSSAFWIPDIDMEASFSLNQTCTIFTAEAHAILEALRFIGVNERDRYLIISDSKSVLQAIGNYIHGRTHIYIAKIKNELDKLHNAGFTIEFLWIPGHSGIDGNIYVDSVAVNQTDTHLYPAITYTDLKQDDKGKAIRAWQDRWDSSIFGRHLYQLSPKVNTNPWFKGKRLPRRSTTMVCRLRFSHIRTRQHLFKVNMIDTNRCDCGTAQSIDHLTFTCPLVSHQGRNLLINSLNQIDAGNFTIQELLKKDDDRIYRILYRFYLDNNILI